LNEQFLLVQNHIDSKNIDENPTYYDDNEDISELVVQNVPKRKKLDSNEEDPLVTARETITYIELL